MIFERTFDAVVGRYVLQFQVDPAAMLRKLAGHVAPGRLGRLPRAGLGRRRSVPPAQIFDDSRRWMSETMRLSGVEIHMGAKLHSTFIAAGLPTPTMRTEH